ncbi:protein dip1 [Gigaspora margarita]|uniref:Protein dip1 n=1 Tax=Gigaspora margarita TaxID=4874 RepID=A0A8H4ALV5_GIGMA|nr:protein dip1 [Gigaspora margarita]
MHDEIIYHLENSEQFWIELDDILTQGQQNQDTARRSIDAYVNFVSKFQDEYLETDSQLTQCFYNLLNSSMYQTFSNIIIERTIHRATTRKELKELWVIFNVLYLAGKNNPAIFKLMVSSQEHDFILKLKEYIKDLDEGHRVQQISVNLLFEICRCQRISQNELSIFDDQFFDHLLNLVENTRDEEDETFNYSIIRLMLSLNEQFMLAVHGTSNDEDNDLDHNALLRVLSARIGTSKTFGENVIFMFNRAVEPQIQMLILKLLYEVFTTPETTEYFYTNDLHVVIDVFIRELYDLPEESEALRHTYLRVLYPLITNTQLCQHRYKQRQIYSLLSDLSGVSTEHFKPVTRTTQRLVETCLRSEYFEGIAPDKCINGMKIMPTLNSMMFDTSGSTVTVTSSGNDVPVQGMLVHGI